MHIFGLSKSTLALSRGPGHVYLKKLSPAQVSESQKPNLLLCLFSHLFPHDVRRRYPAPADGAAPADTHCFFAGIVMIDKVPADPKMVKMVATVLPQGPAYPHLKDTINDVEGLGLPLTVDYDNKWQLSFNGGAVCFVQGLCSVDIRRPTDGPHPRVSVRADQFFPVGSFPLI